MQLNIAQEVRSFVIDTFLFGQGDRLRDDASFIGEGLVDSTGILELVSFLEEHYALQLADDELIPDNLDSIVRVTAFVTRKLDATTQVTPATEHTVMMTAAFD